MNSGKLKRIVLNGFKSIFECDIQMSNINVLIGANGAGKSNFISFFKLIQKILEGALQKEISRQGGPDALLYFGRKTTGSFSVELYFEGGNGYEFTLEPTNDNKMFFSKEFFLSTENSDFGTAHFEAKIGEVRKNRIDCVLNLKNCVVYNFQDMSDTADIKQIQKINDNLFLKPNGANLAAYLYFLQKGHPSCFRRIVEVCRLVAPFFGEFVLRPNTENKEQIELEWFQKNSDIPFKAHHFSDGTLRFICLATLLLQPEEKQPSVLIIDDIELGLHPSAINILVGLLRSVSQKKQMIISTQSADLVSECSPEDVIVVDHEKNKPTFTRLRSEGLEDWLAQYSLGELWKKNVFGGRP